MACVITLIQLKNTQVEKYIKLPKTIKDLRIKHFDSLSDPMVNLEEPTLTDKCYFVAKFAGLTIDEVKSFTVSDVLRMHEHIVGIFDGFKPKAMPPMEITLNGKVYERVNPEKVATSWHIDIATKSIQKDPVELACMFYFPKGEIYGAVDVNKNFLNPIRERYSDFQQHMELTTFMEANAFFLNSWAKSTRRFMVTRNSKNRIAKRVVNMVRMIGQR